MVRYRHRGKWLVVLARTGVPPRMPRCPVQWLRGVAVALSAALMLACLLGRGRHSAIAAQPHVGSVKDFGAVRDGVTDNTQAILHAIAAGRALVLAGTFRATNWHTTTWRTVGSS